MTFCGSAMVHVYWYVHSTLTLRSMVQTPLSPGTFFLQQDTLSTLLLSIQQAKNIFFYFGGLLFTSKWLNRQHWTGFIIAVYGNFQPGLFFDFWGLFFVFWGRNGPESLCNFFPCDPGVYKWGSGRMHYGWVGVGAPVKCRLAWMLPRELRKCTVSAGLILNPITRVIIHCEVH